MNIIQNNYIFFLSLIITFILSGNFLLNLSKRFRYFNDQQNEIQKIHIKKSTRLGGLSILITFYFILIFKLENYYSSTFLIIALPFFIIGFIEDLTNKLSVSVRFFLLLFASAIPVLFLGFIISEVDINFLNNFLKMPFFAVIFSVLGIAAVANSWNFIDGLNGFSSGTALVIIFFLSFISHNEGLLELSELLYILGQVVFGFWVVNLIFGNIFLGDSGAYFLGFFIALSGIEISNKSENISAWLIMFIIVYPVTELLFTIFRRLFIFQSPFKADNKHFHSLLYLLVVRQNIKLSRTYINSLCGIICMTLSAMPLVVSIIFDLSYIGYIQGILIFFFLYFLSYITLNGVKNY